ncbi:MAG: tryptophan-rich sensory protein [Longimonas sp.]|uniref:TspO/MBR family protein n=1 Tax=Longimonas sp. TaxID=2039626 RepID=UPI003346F38C
MATQNRTWMRDAGLLLAALVLCQGVGALAGYVTQGPVQTWYPTLNKPFFTPPDWLFAPVWITLYAMMAVAWYLVLRQGWGDAQVKQATWAFLVQLALNGAWSFVFFGMQSIAGGLVVIIALLLAIRWTLKRFRPLSKPAFWLLIPYVFWTMYATLLNGTLWMMN